MSGGSDISFLSNLRIPCAVTLGIALLLIALAVGSCVSCMTARPEPGAEPTDLALTAG
jgi:hypothetical protein